MAFLESLTDERVRWEMAPFDHPSLDIPNGAQGDAASVGDGSGGLLAGESTDNVVSLPATGAGGRTASDGPVKGFLPDDGGDGAGTQGGGADDPITNVVCYETANGVVISWTATTPIDSIVIEVDHAGVMGSEVISLSGSELSFEDAEFRSGVTGYLITPFALGSELESSACYIRRGEVPGQVPHFLRGDMNSDGFIDIADAIETLEGVFLGGLLACGDAADWNDDGKVDISDPIGTLTYLFGSGAAPALPYPQCGSDPSFDSLGCGQLDLCQ